MNTVVQEEGQLHESCLSCMQNIYKSIDAKQQYGPNLTTLEDFTKKGHTDRSRHQAMVPSTILHSTFPFRAKRPDAECGKQMNEPQGQRPSSRWGSALSWGVLPRKKKHRRNICFCLCRLCMQGNYRIHTSHSCSCIFWIGSTAVFLVGFTETERNKLRHRA